jgi:hypothetical protein
VPVAASQLEEPLPSRHVVFASVFQPRPASSAATAASAAVWNPDVSLLSSHSSVGSTPVERFGVLDVEQPLVKKVLYWSVMHVRFSFLVCWWWKYTAVVCFFLLLFFFACMCIFFIVFDRTSPHVSWICVMCMSSIFLILLFYHSMCKKVQDIKFILDHRECAMLACVMTDEMNMYFDVRHIHAQNRNFCCYPLLLLLLLLPPVVL